jgi:hypothetical protein
VVVDRGPDSSSSFLSKWRRRLGVGGPKRGRFIGATGIGVECTANPQPKELRNRKQLMNFYPPSPCPLPPCEGGRGVLGLKLVC